MRQEGMLSTTQLAHDGRVPTVGMATAAHSRFRLADATEVLGIHVSGQQADDDLDHQQFEEREPVACAA